MCKVSWCNNETEFYNKTQRYAFCPIHIQYKQICGAAAFKDRPNLMYKVEKFVKGEHQCESCGFDPVVSYPNLHTYHPSYQHINQLVSS